MARQLCSFKLSDSNAHSTDKYEYKFAMKLLHIPRNLNLEKTHRLFITPLERYELVKECIDIRISFDWNFNFQEFYEALQTYKCLPLEFLWNLHFLQVMPLEIYILSIYSDKDVFQNFSESFLRLCTQDFDENYPLYLIQTGFLCFFVRKAFPVVESSYDEKIKEICLEVIRSLLQAVFSAGEDEIKNKRFTGFFSLWNAGILEEESFRHFCSFSLDIYLSFESSSNDLQAFEVLENSFANLSPYHLLTIIEKLVKIQDKDGIANILKSVVQKSQINAKSLLVVVKASLQTFVEEPAFITKLALQLMNEAYAKFCHKSLARSLLIGYQTVYQSNISPHPPCRSWLQTVFKECGHCKDKNSFLLLLHVLSDIVPFHKNIECLKVAIDLNFPVPPEVQTMYNDYIILLKTRIQDLKPSSNTEVTVEKAMALFESLGKIPPVIMEISLLQKQKFLNEFLPALLIPRVVPQVPDVRERFIEALSKAGKIPSSCLQKYKKSCMEKQSEIIIDISMIDENFDDFVNEDNL